jgi:hypothetical protein
MEKNSKPTETKNLNFHVKSVTDGETFETLYHLSTISPSNFVTSTTELTWNNPYKIQILLFFELSLTIY